MRFMVVCCILLLGAAVVTAVPRKLRFRRASVAHVTCPSGPPITPQPSGGVEQDATIITPPMCNPCTATDFTSAFDRLTHWASTRTATHVPFLEFALLMKNFAHTADNGRKQLISVVPPHKSRESAQLKVLGDYRNNMLKLVDFFRGSIVVQRVEQLNEAICQFRTFLVAPDGPAHRLGCAVIYDKDNTELRAGTSGYRDFKTVAKCKFDGVHFMAFEVQFHVCSLLKAKEQTPHPDGFTTNGHGYYEIRRKIQQETEHGRPQAEWSDASRNAWKAALDEEYRLNVWAGSDPAYVNSCKLDKKLMDAMGCRAPVQATETATDIEKCYATGEIA